MTREYLQETLVRFLESLLKGGTEKVRDLLDAGALPPGTPGLIPCVGPEAAAAIAACLEAALTSWNGEVHRISHAGIHPGVPGLAAFAPTLDAIHGSGAFASVLAEQGLPPIDAELIELAPADFDARMEALYPELNPASLERNSIALVDGVVARLLSARPSRPSLHFVFENPNLVDTEVFNTLLLLVREARSADSPIPIHFWMVGDVSGQNDLRHFDLFFELCRIENPSTQRLAWPCPTTVDVRRLLAEATGNPERAAELAADIIMRLKNDFGLSLTPEEAVIPSIWIQAFADAAPEALRRPEEAPVRPTPAEAIDLEKCSPSEVLTCLLRHCAFERLQLWLAARPELVLRSPFCQYLYVCSQWPRFGNLVQPWLDAWRTAPGPRSRFVAAALSRTAWFHGFDDLLADILERLAGPWKSEVSWVSYHVILSWTATMWRAQSDEVDAKVPEFREILSRFHPTCEETVVSDLSAVLDLARWAINPAALQEEGAQERLKEHLHIIRDDLPGLGNRLPFILTEVASDLYYLPAELVNSRCLLAVAARDVELRMRYVRPSTLPINLNNYASMLAMDGLFAAASRYFGMSTVISNFNENPRDKALSNLDCASNVVTGGLSGKELLGRIHEGLALLREQGNEELTAKYSVLALDALFILEPLPWLRDYLTRLDEAHGASIARNEQLALRLGTVRFLLDCALEGERCPAEAPALVVRRLATSSAAARACHEALKATPAPGAEVAHLHAILELLFHAAQDELGDALKAVGRLDTLVHAAHRALPPLWAALLCAASELLPAGCAPRRLADHLVHESLLHAFFTGWDTDAQRQELLESPLVQRILGATEPPLPEELHSTWIQAESGLLHLQSHTALLRAVALVVMLALSPERIVVRCRGSQREHREALWRRNPAFRTLPFRSLGQAWLHDDSTRGALPGPRMARAQLREGEWVMRLHEKSFECLADSGAFSLEIEWSDAARAGRHWESCVRDELFQAFLSGILTNVERLHESERRHRTETQTRQIAMRMVASALELSDLLNAEREKLREANSRLKELDEAKKRFFANVSHELRTPLTLSLGILEDIHGRGLPLGEDIGRLLATGIRAQRQLLGLVNDLLDQAKIEAGKMTFSPTHIELANRIQDIAELFRPEAERLGIGLELKDDGTHPAAYADANHLERILFNLLSNALKFTPSGGRVTLSCGSGGSQKAFVSVRDSGKGMDQETLSHLFERFAGGTRGQGMTQEGTGIGLSLVKDLASINGGDVSVASEPGSGTEFLLHLPLGEKDKCMVAVLPTHGVAAIVRDLSEVPSRPRHPRPELPSLLVAEDSNEIKLLIRAGLETHFNLYFATNGEDGWRLLLENRVDCILSDLMMPVSDGLEFLRRVRAEPSTRFIPFVMLTARADETIKHTCFEEGVTDFLTKPFSPFELLLRMRNLAHFERMRGSLQDAIALERMAQLAIAVSHEINNPLQIMELIVEELGDQELADEAKAETQKLGACIDRMRESMTKLNTFKSQTRRVAAGTTLAEVAQALGLG